MAAEYVSPFNIEENRFGPDQLAPAAPIQAYAKLQGPDWIYYIQSLAITIGRSPEGTLPANPEDAIDVDLGATRKNVSRKHAKIQFNFRTRKWELVVLGRNGVRHNGELYKPAPEAVLLESGDVLDIGGVSFEFGLPTAVEEAQEPEEEEVPHDELLDEDDHLLEIEEEPEDLDIDDFEEIEEKPKKKKKPKAKPKPKPKAEPKKAEPKKAPPKAEPKKSRAAPKPDKIVEEVEQEEEIKKAEPKQPKAEQPPKSKTLKRKREPDPVLPVYPPGENPYPKPEFSYAAMLAEAINAEPERRLSLQGLYESLRERYPYFRYAGTKWKNSVRHHLSFNQGFQKVATDDPKSSIWTIDPAYAGRYEEGPRPRRTLRAELEAGEHPTTEEKKKRRTYGPSATYGLFEGEDIGGINAAFEGAADLPVAKELSNLDMMRYLRRPGDPSAYEYPLQIPDAAQIMKRLHPQFFVFRVGDQDPAEPVRGDMLELTRTLPKIDSDEGRALMANDIKAQLLIKGVGKKKEKENPVAPA